MLIRRGDILIREENDDRYIIAPTPEYTGFVIYSERDHNLYSSTIIPKVKDGHTDERLIRTYIPSFGSFKHLTKEQDKQEKAEKLLDEIESKTKVEPVQVEVTKTTSEFELEKVIAHKMVNMPADATPKVMLRALTYAVVNHLEKEGVVKFD